MINGKLPTRNYTNGIFPITLEEVAGSKVTYIIPNGPRRSGDLVPIGLAVRDEDLNETVIYVGDTVTLTGRFWLQIEREWDDNTYEEFEYELAEVTLEDGFTGWVPFNEITEESHGGFHVEAA